MVNPDFATLDAGLVQNEPVAFCNTRPAPQGAKGVIVTHGNIACTSSKSRLAPSHFPWRTTTECDGQLAPTIFMTWVFIGEHWQPSMPGFLHHYVANDFASSRSQWLRLFRIIGHDHRRSELRI